MKGLLKSLKKAVSVEVPLQEGPNIDAPQGLARPADAPRSHSRTRSQPNVRSDVPLKPALGRSQSVFVKNEADDLLLEQWKQSKAIVDFMEASGKDLVMGDITELDFREAVLWQMSHYKEGSSRSGAFLEAMCAMFRTVQMSRSLLTFTRRINASIGKSELLASIVDSMYPILNAERVTLFFVDTNTRAVLGCPSQHGVVEWVAASARTWAGTKAEVDAETCFDKSDVLDNSEREMRSILCSPVMDLHRGQVAAVIRAVNKRDADCFSDTEEQLMTFIGVLVGQAIDNSCMYEKSIESSRKLETLLHLFEIMSAESGVDRVVKSITDAAYQLLDIDWISFYLVDDNRGDLICKVSKDRHAEGTIVDINKGVLGHVFRTGQSVRIDNASLDPRFDSCVDCITGYLTKSLLSVPIVSGGATIAILHVANRKASAAPCDQSQQQQHAPRSLRSVYTAFEQGDEDLMISLARAAGVMLQKAHAHDSLVRAERKYRALFDVVKVSEERDAEKLIHQLLKICYKLLDAERIALFFVDKVKGDLYCVVSPDARGFCMPLTSGIVGAVALGGEGLNIPDAYLDHRFDPSFDKLTGNRTRSLLCSPVKDSAGAVMAVIQAVNKRRPDGGSGCFTQEDNELMNAVCIEVGSTLRRHVTEVLLDRGAQLSSPGNQQSVQSLLSIYGYSDMSFVATTPVSSSLSSRDYPTASGDRTSDGILRHLSMSRQRQSTVVERLRGSFDMTGSTLGTLPAGTLPATLHVSMASLKSFEFNALDFTADELELFVYIIFEDLGLLTLGIPPDILAQFVHAVRGRYRDNPYHNWFHGFCVFHFVYLTLVKTSARAVLDKLDVLGCVVAALCHDIDHPGNNNTFEVHVTSVMARQHNDISVLENHHAYTTLELLRNPALGIFAHLGRKEQGTLRRIIIKGILATDMVHHFDMVSTLQKRFHDISHVDKAVEADRQFVINLLVHAADLSGQALPLSVAIPWEERVSTEFKQQAVREMELELPPTAHIQNLNDRSVRAQSHLNFLDFIMTPFWIAAASLFPKLKPCCDNLTRSRQHFLNIKKQEEMGRKRLSSESLASFNATGSVKQHASLPTKAEAADVHTKSNIGTAKPTGPLKSKTTAQAKKRDRSKKKKKNGKVSKDDGLVVADPSTPKKGSPRASSRSSRTPRGSPRGSRCDTTPNATTLCVPSPRSRKGRTDKPDETHGKAMLDKTKGNVQRGTNDGVVAGGGAESAEGTGSDDSLTFDGRMITNLRLSLVHSGVSGHSSLHSSFSSKSGFETASWKDGSEPGTPVSLPSLSLGPAQHSYSGSHASLPALSDVEPASPSSSPNLSPVSPVTGRRSLGGKKRSKKKIKKRK